MITDDQQKQIDWWSYLVKGISSQHQRNWYNDILRNKGIEEAELFNKRCNYINNQAKSLT